MNSTSRSFFRNLGEIIVADKLKADFYVSRAAFYGTFVLENNVHLIWDFLYYKKVYPFYSKAEQKNWFRLWKKPQKNGN